MRRERRGADRGSRAFELLQVEAWPEFQHFTSLDQLHWCVQNVYGKSSTQEEDSAFRCC